MRLQCILHTAHHITYYHQCLIRWVSTLYGIDYIVPVMHNMLCISDSTHHITYYQCLMTQVSTIQSAHRITYYHFLITRMSTVYITQCPLNYILSVLDNTGVHSILCPSHYKLLVLDNMGVYRIYHTLPTALLLKFSNLAEPLLTNKKTSRADSLIFIHVRIKHLSGCCHHGAVPNIHTVRCFVYSSYISCAAAPPSSHLAYLSTSVVFITTSSLRACRSDHTNHKWK